MPVTSIFSSFAKTRKHKKAANPEKKGFILKIYAGVLIDANLKKTKFFNLAQAWRYDGFGFVHFLASLL